MKKIRLLLLTIVLVVFVYAGYLYWEKVTDPGEFNKYGHAALNNDIAEVNWPIYVSYSLVWEGFGEVELEKVEFKRRDGSTLESNEEIELEAFVNNVSWGAFPEEHAVQEGRLKDLEPVRGFRVKDDETINLVIKLSILDERFIDDINQIKVTFNKMGNTHHQNIPFEGFLDER